jgi:hypothetical protein
MRSISDCKSEPDITKFIEFLRPLVRSHQVLENWQRFRATMRRHARQIRNIDHADNIADPDWFPSYVFDSHCESTNDINQVAANVRRNQDNDSLRYMLLLHPS